MAKKRAGIAEKVISEVCGKQEDFESAQSKYISEVGEFGDLFKVKPPSRGKEFSAFSNPRLTEFFRASNTIATLLYRMMTSNDPFFSVKSMDLRADFEKTGVIQDTLVAQMRATDYRRHLLRANMFVVPFGTVICQEDFVEKTMSSFGRKLPATTFRPRLMDCVSFERGTTDIEEAEWIATADLVANSALKAMAEDKDLDEDVWIRAGLREASAYTESDQSINPFVRSRMARANFDQTEMMTGRKEFTLYYGKLDCLNDGIEYVVGIVNRRHLVRFHVNNFQHGKRQFRIARWVDFDEPTGLGLGHMLGWLHKSMDAQRQRITDLVSMGTYNMWMRLRSGGISENDMKIRPLQIIDADEPGALAPLSPDMRAAEAGLKLEEMQKQEFRAASGAVDSLQAIITEGTATEVSLAQNESMRNISVKAEQIAEKLVREHLYVCHENNVQFAPGAFTISRNGIPTRVYPKDLRYDVDFELQLTTDKNFRPQRLDKVIQLIQILTSTKSAHPDQFQISILPLIKEAAAALGVKPEEVITPPTMQPGMMGPMDMSQMGAGTIPAIPGQPSMAPSVGMSSTPVGDVMGSP